jgi:hypothetical protein
MARGGLCESWECMMALCLGLLRMPAARMLKKGSV